MTDYTELVKALRHTDFGDTCDHCERWGMCKDDDCIILQAAAAIEALQAELIRIYKQLPKQGEWIWDDKRCIYVCSVCGSPKVRENMDRQIIKEQAYCYSCGAKMEVQE